MNVSYYIPYSFKRQDPADALNPGLELSSSSGLEENSIESLFNSSTLYIQMSAIYLCLFSKFPSVRSLSLAHIFL